MPDRMIVVVSGGGTGGHLYPALAIADELRAVRSDVHCVFVGAERGLEARVLPERGEDHVLLRLSGIDRARLSSAWRPVFELLKGIARTLRIFSELRPRLVVVTGGYAAAPAGFAAAIAGIPLVLQDQNSYPGLVTRLLRRFATRIHLAYPEAVDRLAGTPARLVISGNPVRDRAPVRQADARRGFGVPKDAFLTLITGGSQGSLALNEGVVAWVAAMVSRSVGRPDALHLLWATGPKHFTGITRALEDIGEPSWVHATPYLEDMPSALVAADLALSRAGAMTIAEFLNEGLPALLVPLPTSAEDHQMHNARALASAGASRLIPQDELSPERLADEVARLADGPVVMDEMKSRARSRARPHAARDIARDLETILPTGRAA